MFNVHWTGFRQKRNLINGNNETGKQWKTTTNISKKKIALKQKNRRKKIMQTFLQIATDPSGRIQYFFTLVFSPSQSFHSLFGFWDESVWALCYINNVFVSISNRRSPKSECHYQMGGLIKLLLYWSIIIIDPMEWLCQL